MAQYEARLRDAKAEAGARRAEALKQAQAEETAVLEKARKEASDSLGFDSGPGCQRSWLKRESC